MLSTIAFRHVIIERFLIMAVLLGCTLIWIHGLLFLGSKAPMAINLINDWLIRALSILLTP